MRLLRPKTERLVRKIKRTPGLVIPVEFDERAVFVAAEDMIYVYAKRRWRDL